jgi:CTP:phosphocholine cytidylyltransferase-like protein
MNTFILSAGKQLRFPDNHTPKQLLVVGGETILERQIRQLAEYDVIPTVVTHNDEIKTKSPKWIHPENNKTVQDTLASTFDHWIDDEAIILLGDVFYSHDLMANIISCELPIKFWLSGSEIFALKTKKKQFLINGIKGCTKTRGDRKLWHLYRKLNNANINKHQIFNNKMTGNIVVDYTFDIDSLVQYQDVSKYVDKLKEANPDV